MARRSSTIPTLLIVLAVALGVTAVVRAWFGNNVVSAGLWGIERCDHGCRGVRWDNVHPLDFDIVIAGYVATVTALLGAVLTLLTGIAAFGGKRGPAILAGRVIGVTIIAMIWFVVRLLMGNADPDWAMFVGPAAAIGASFALRRV